MGQEINERWTYSDLKTEPVPQSRWTYTAPIAKPKYVLKDQKKVSVIGETLKGAAKDVGELLLAPLEAATATASGIPATIGGAVAQGAAGLYDIWKTGGKNIASPADVLRTVERQKGIREKIVDVAAYKPKTALGEHLAVGASTPYALPLMALQKGVDVVAKATGADEELRGGLSWLTEIAFLLSIKPAISYVKGKVAARQPIKPETLIRYIEENAPPEIIEEMKTKISDKYFKRPEEILQPGAVRGGSILPTLALPKRVGPINLERLGVDYSAQKMVADIEDAIHLERVKSGRHKISWQETEEQANVIGGAYEIGQAINKSVEEVLKDFGAVTKDLPAKVEASRAILRTSLDELVAASKEMVDNPSDAVEAKTQYLWQRHAAIQYAVGQASSEIGRSLNIHKKLARSRDYLLSSLHKKVLDNLGQDKLTPEAIEMLATFDTANPTTALKFLAGVKKATKRQKIFEFYINCLLSNPKTHIINTTSNTVTQIWNMLESVGAAGLEVAVHPLKPSKRAIYFGENAYALASLIHGLKEGSRRFEQVMKTGLTESQVSKMEIPSQAIKGLPGEVVRTPGKLLAAEDEFFKGGIYFEEIARMAYRKATQEGLRGEARKSRIVELSSNPTDSMVIEANQATRTRTFQAELGKLGQIPTKLRAAVPGLEFIMPFTRTPTNIIKYGLIRTPLGIPMTTWEVYKGKIGRAEFSKIAASQLASTAMAIVLAKKVADGDITGTGPKDPNERRVLYQTGWQPNSIKINDAYYSYARVEPLATVLGMMTDFHEVRKYVDVATADKLAAQIVYAMKNNLTNKTFFMGLMGAVKAGDQPDKEFVNWLEKMAASTVPAVAGGMARAIDPYFREPKTLLEQIKARIPFLSQQIPPRLSPFGEPIERPGTPASRLLSPVDVSRQVKDVVYDELARLHYRLAPARPTVKGKQVSKEDARKILTDVGPKMKAMLETVINSPEYQSSSDESKKKQVKRIITWFRTLGRNTFELEEIK